ncbi:hypothetical protein TrVE_jg4218 [Triparma verrucosa]|uniref:Aspartyl/asparaginy/proline hydroxylase domain-containing protein n=1 Tax=Triparma verrucosa TaxID=1606542 RepID=A0A9W7DSE5_9STRA|nr:hypothetical protein TrVE_jg4218 [Triparma verrucosa]
MLVDHCWTFSASKGFASKGFGSSSSSNSKQQTAKVKSVKGFGSQRPRAPSKSKPAPQSTNKPQDTTQIDPTLTLENCVPKALQKISQDPSLYTVPTSLDFFELLPPLLSSRYPTIPSRIPSFIHTYLLLSSLNSPEDSHKLLPASYTSDPRRPTKDVHAFMPGINSPTPFLDPSLFPLVKTLEDNLETIRSEYQALRSHFSGSPSGFKSLTSLNYDSGWSTLNLHQNSHRLPSFPYDLCPLTLSLLESFPIAGRISGFNRQLPGTGIPEHSDGNNMWLTLQMPLHTEKGKARIVNGGEERVYVEGECEIYDTTYSHYTFNEGESERVVLHVDFWNWKEMEGEEIDVMKYVYELKEKFEGAERGSY